MPHLSDHDLRQMDEAWQSHLTEPQARAVLSRVLEDLRQARDRLSQNASNSSRPPGSVPHWEKPGADQDGDGDDPPPPPASPAEAEADEAEAEAAGPDGPEPRAQPKAAGAAKKPGKPPGAPGHGRTQTLVPDATLHRHPEQCAACGRALADGAPGPAYTAWTTVELAPPAEGAAGLRLGVTRTVLHEAACACGHRTRARHGQAPADALWERVELGEWRLLGPRLASLLVLLTLRYRLSRAKVGELLQDLLGLSVSTGLIDATVREAGRAVEPLEAQIVAHIEQAAVLYADETSWPEAGRPLWLWVFATAHAVLYLIGSRAKEMVANALPDAFRGDLMSDGYRAYRAFPRRLRCWAHLQRKLAGLSESTDARVAGAGAALRGAFEALWQAVYAARETGPPPASRARENAAKIEAFRSLCERHRDDGHAKLGAVAGEFLNDWDVIVRPLSEPWLPLTNNEAERALRHFVIARRVSHGTRRPTGSRAYALLASVIETCRRREASPLDFLGAAIAAARQGSALPQLPEIQAAAG